MTERGHDARPKPARPDEAPYREKTSGVRPVPDGGRETLSVRHVQVTDVPLVLDDGLLAGVVDPLIMTLISGVDGSSSILEIAEGAGLEPEHVRACFGFLGNMGVVAFGRAAPTPVSQRVASTPRPPAPSLPPPAHRSEVGGTETILVVDDDSGVRRVVCRFLARLGYQVLVADGGPAALAAAAAHPGEIHLLLTDVMMPGVSGPELASSLTRVRPRLRVLFATGSGHAALRTAAVPTFAVLEKPFSGTAVAAAVRAVLDEVRPATESPPRA